MKDLSLHIMDIFQNSTRAGATEVQLNIEESHDEDTLTIEFIDNGSGMDSETLSHVLDPFYTTRTTRKVGMGLSLMKQNAELTGGGLTIRSELNVGTIVSVTFGLTHIDRQPLGDVASTLILTVAANPEIRFLFHYKTPDVDFLFDTEEIKEALDGVSIQEPEMVQAMTEYVRNNMVPEEPDYE